LELGRHHLRSRSIRERCSGLGVGSSGHALTDRTEPEVAGDFVVKQLVLPFRSGSNIVNDPFFAAARTWPRDYDANVTPSLFGCSVRKTPGDNVSYVVVIE